MAATKPNLAYQGWAAASDEHAGDRPASEPTSAHEHKWHASSAPVSEAASLLRGRNQVLETMSVRGWVLASTTSYVHDGELEVIDTFRWGSGEAGA